jgi:hypothetical protein
MILIKDLLSNTVFLPLIKEDTALAERDSKGQNFTGILLFQIPLNRPCLLQTGPIAIIIE